MSPADLRALMATAERQPGETTEQYTARHAAEHQLSGWRTWLPGLLARDAKLTEALTAWKCGSCGGSGWYKNKFMRGTEHVEEDVLCKVCVGHGLHPIARVALEYFPIAPASQAGMRAPAAIRSLPAGAHSPSDMTQAEAEVRGFV